MLGQNNRPRSGRRSSGGGFGRGSPSTLSRKGVRGYHTRENFEMLYSKRCIFVHYKWYLQCYFALKKPHGDWLSDTSQSGWNIFGSQLSLKNTKFMIYNKNYNTDEWTLRNTSETLSERKSIQNFSIAKLLDYATFLNMQHILKLRMSKHDRLLIVINDFKHKT